MAQQDTTETDDLSLIPGSQWWREPTSTSCPLPQHTGTLTNKQMQKKKKQVLKNYSPKQAPQILGKLMLFLIKTVFLLSFGKYSVR